VTSDPTRRTELAVALNRPDVVLVDSAVEVRYSESVPELLPPLVVAESVPPEYDIRYNAQVVAIELLLLRSVVVPFDAPNFRLVPGQSPMQAVFVPLVPYEKSALAVVAVLASLDQKETVLVDDPIMDVMTVLALKLEDPSRLRTVPYVESVTATGVPDNVLRGYVDVDSVPIELDELNGYLAMYESDEVSWTENVFEVDPPNDDVAVTVYPPPDNPVRVVLVEAPSLHETE